QRGLDRLVEVQLLLGVVPQRGSQGGKETVGSENAEKGTDQSGTDLLADLRIVGSRQNGHGDHDAQHRGHDTHGRQAIRHLGHGMGRMLQLLLEAGQLHIEEVLQLVGRHVAAGHDAQVVTDERCHLRILEDGRILAEYRAGLGLLEIGLDGHHALAAALVEDLVEQLEHFQIKGMGEAAAEHGQRLLQHDLESAAGVGLQEATQRRATDDHHLKGMHQRHEVAAREHETAQHAAEYNQYTDDLDHGRIKLEELGKRVVGNSPSIYRKYCARL